MSSTEREHDPDLAESQKKKIRGESVASSVVDASDVALPPSPLADTREVVEVTQGVKEVEIADPDEGVAPAPEGVPLPEEEAGELDEPGPGAEAVPPLEEGEVSQAKTDDEAGGSAADADDDTSDREDNIASSENEEETPVSASVVVEEEVALVLAAEGLAAGTKRQLRSSTKQATSRDKD